MSYIILIRPLSGLKWRFKWKKTLCIPSEGNIKMKNKGQECLTLNLYKKLCFIQSSFYCMKIEPVIKSITIDWIFLKTLTCTDARQKKEISNQLAHVTLIRHHNIHSRSDSKSGLSIYKRVSGVREKHTTNYTHVHSERSVVSTHLMYR